MFMSYTILSIEFLILNQYIFINGVRCCIHHAGENALSDTLVLNYDEGSLVSSSGDYQMPLVWIDLEMTGVFFELSLVYLATLWEEFIFMLHFHYFFRPNSLCFYHASE